MSAVAYGRFMGRFSEPLAPLVADASGVAPGQTVLDVGCGPGALTAVLVERLGPDHVHAVDTSASFVDAARARLPGVDVQVASAQALPFEADVFDATLAQLVVHFMNDPVAGLREMARVTRPGGIVAACVWDQAGGTSPLSPFWETVRSLDPLEDGEAHLPGARAGHLAQLFEQAGLRPADDSSLSVQVTFDTFEDWWEPYTLGVGPAGVYVHQLDDLGRDALRAACRERLGSGPFDVQATAWFVRALT